MILTSGGIKGGTGKSTIAINLVSWLHLQGKKVLLVDADAQATASDFAAERTETLKQTGFTTIQLHNKAVRTEILNLKDSFDFVVIDTGGRDTTSQRAALTISDILLLPFAPRSFDIWTLDKVSLLIEEIEAINDKLNAMAFLNKADPSNRTIDNDAAKEIISDYENISFVDASIGNRKVFGDSTATGLSIFEHKPKNDKAITELTYLFDTILNLKNN